MNQDLMTRLFRSIEGNQNDAIIKVATKIIEDEKQKGHVRLADRLKGILEANISATPTFRKEFRALFPLGTTIPTDKLKSFGIEIIAGILKKSAKF